MLSKLFGVILLGIVKCTFRVLEPDSLIQGEVPYSLSNFGEIPYGKASSGQIFLHRDNYSNYDLCHETERPTPAQDTRVVLWMITIRGNCSFT
jgi:hypothetical protein